MEEEHDDSKVRPPRDATSRGAKGIAEAVGRLRKVLDLWKDQHGNGYATASVGEKQQNMAIYSEGFRRYLRRWLQLNSAPVTKSSMAYAQAQLAETAESGPTYHVAKRVGFLNGIMYLDLADESGRIIEISATEPPKVLTEKCPVKFIQYEGMGALPMPDLTQTGELDLSFLNIHSTEHKMLLQAQLLSTLAPGPYPPVFLVGSWGTSKSSTARALKRMTDPCDTDLRSLSITEHDFAVASKSTHVLAVDNVSKMNDAQQDIFCRTSTGAGFAKRLLYEDDREIRFQLGNPLIVTAVDIPIRGDLKNRSIVIEMEKIEPKNRITEVVFWQRFNDVWPANLGKLLNALHCALRRQPEVIVEELPRMADFALLVTAAEPAFGWADNSFIPVFNANQEEANQPTEFKQAIPLVDYITQLVETEEFYGTPSHLLLKLRETYGDVAGLKWPANPNQLGIEFNKIKTSLELSGIHIEQGRGFNRFIKMTMKPAGL